MVVLAGISFLSPVMLWGGALVSLPIAAHLLTRRTRRRIVFPTVRLLSESSASTSKLYRLRRWLVLLLRCLAVAAIILAFTRPVWTGPGERPATAGRGAAVVILLDASASTARHSGGVRLADSIRAVAERTLNSLRNGTDRVGVVYATAQPRTAFPELSSNLRVIREELQRLKPTHERANFPEAIALAARLLEPHPGQRRLVILSDMQRSNWADVTLQGARGAVLPAGTLVTILPVGAGESENVCLSNPRAMPVRPIADQPVKLAVHVTNYSPRERSIKVEATLGGRQIGTRKVTLKAWGAGDAEFETHLDSLGSHRVVFSTAPDALAVDNHAYLSVTAVRRVPVVIIGDDNPGQSGSATYLMIRALAPRGDMGDDLEVRHLTSADLSYARILDAQAVFVSYVGRLGPDALKALHMYVNQGGGVAFCCGDGPVVENLLGLKSLAGRAEVLPWMPATPRNLAADGSFLRIGDGAWKSELLTEFDERCQEALKQVRFARVWSTGSLRPGGRNLLTYADGTPAMSVQNVGAGKLVLCNFSPSLRHSDLGKYGGFVALMQCMFKYLQPTDRLYGGAIAGQPFTCSVTIPGAPGALRLTVIGPDERPCQADVTAEADRVMVNVRRPKLPGFYTISRNDQPVAYVSVNVDSREGDLRRAPPDVLREHLKSEEIGLEIRSHEREGPILRIRGKPLWKWFVLAAMGVIALELALLGIWKR